RRIAGGEALAGPPAAAPAAADTQASLLQTASVPAPPPPPPAPPAPSFPADFRALHDALVRGNHHLIAQRLHDFVGLVRYAPPDLVVRRTGPLPADFARDLAATLKAISGATWEVTFTEGTSEPSLLDQERALETAARDEILGSPIVRASFEAFPDAELIGYTAERRSIAP
ncbi:MAG: polymerase subunit gamma/tau, partial [Sphingomonas bacterium]|nr:polymerase subunit gamma/tau [Sphingomonas bacterium]